MNLDNHGLCECLLKTSKMQEPMYFGYLAISSKKGYISYEFCKLTGKKHASIL